MCSRRDIEDRSIWAASIPLCAACLATAQASSMAEINLRFHSRVLRRTSPCFSPDADVTPQRERSQGSRACFHSNVCSFWMNLHVNSSSPLIVRTIAPRVLSAGRQCLYSQTRALHESAPGNLLGFINRDRRRQHLSMAKCARRTSHDPRRSAGNMYRAMHCQIAEPVFSW